MRCLRTARPLGQLLYPFRQVSKPGARSAAAAGGCVLVRRSLLEAAGGLEAVRGELIDDAWTLPLAGVLYGGMTMTSAWRHLSGRGARWKGRSYGVDRAWRSR